MESSKAGVVSLTKVQFYTQRKVEFGQAVYVCGNSQALGDWDPRKAPKLEWTKGDNWKKAILLPVPSDIEYKFIISTTDPGDMHYVLWDEGPNAKLSLFGKDADAPITKEINVMSFNIRYDNEGDGANKWYFRKDLVANTIKLYGCDFVGIQEALYHQITDLNSMLPTYMAYGRGRGEHWMAGEACPIYYLHEKWELIEGNTFWLSDMPEIPASTTFGNTIPRICTWAIFKNKLNDDECFVLNTHLDHLNANSQRESAKLIASTIKTIAIKYDKIILMGDFNVGEDDEAIEIIKRVGPKMSESLSEVCPEKKDRKDKGTFHHWTGIRDSLKIDYIFVSSALKTKEFKIIYDNIKGKYPSDHFPIIGVFTPTKEPSK